MRPIRIYLSGPITGIDDYMERFLETEARVKRQWNEVLNPAKVGKMLPVLGHSEYMTIDLAMLKICDVILLMKGWQQSKGCMEEYEFAKEHGIMIVEESNEDEESESV